MSVAGLMSHDEYVLVEMVRTANARLIEQGCPASQLASVHVCPNRSSTWNMWANVRNGALMKLARLRDVPAGAV